MISTLSRNQPNSSGDPSLAIPFAVLGQIIGAATAIIAIRVSVYGVSGVDWASLAVITFGASIMAALFAATAAQGRIGQIAMAAILAILLLLCVPQVAFPFMAAIALGLAILAVWHLRPAFAFASARIVDLAASFAMGAVIAVFHQAMGTYRGHAHALAFETMMSGDQHVDTSFHGAIAAIYQQTAVISVGLDGLVPMQYHVLSHMFFGSVAASLGIPVIEAYSLVVPIIVAPLMLMTLILAANALNPSAFRNVPMATIAILTSMILATSYLFYDRFWNSESLLLSMALLFLAISWVKEHSKERGFMSLPALFSLALLIIAMTYVKAPTAAVAVAGFGLWLVILRRGHWLRGILEAGIFTALPFLVVVALSFSDSDSTILFRPFEYLLREPFQSLPPLVLLAFLTGLAFKRRETDAAILGLLAMGWASFCVTALINTEFGNNAGHFAGAGHWATYLIAFIYATPVLKRKTGVYVGGALWALAIFGVMQTLPYAQKRYVKNLAQLQVAKIIPTNINSGPFGDIRAAISIAPDVQAIVLSPQRLIAFEKQARSCWAGSLTVQAVTGRPLLLGLSPKQSTCIPRAPFYGWAQYDAQTSAARDLAPAELCVFAAKAGFTKVLMVGMPKSIQAVRCDERGALLEIQALELP